MMTKTGMLVVTNPSKFIRYMPRIQKEIKNTLYIQFFPERRLRFPEIKNVQLRKIHPPSFSSTVINFYSNSVPFRHLDVRVLLGAVKDPSLSQIKTKNPVEIVYFDQVLNNDEMQGFLLKCVLNRTSDCEVVALGENEHEDECDNVNGETKQRNDVMYSDVVLGGTFDRLHSGHKILLSEAILRCSAKITVGVTNTEMLKTKKLWELIEACDTRISNVREFLEDVEPRLNYDVVAIGDMYGPTKDDPTFQMLVVSSETLGGGSKVNELRSKNGLEPLVVHSVDLLNDIKLDDEEEDKISSSNGRLRLLGRRLRQPVPGEEAGWRGYVIGLTGGIASGKSSVSARLKELGAGIVNCDRVAHQLYAVGQEAHRLIVSHFGDHVLASSGEIDRRALGDIVFNDKEQLKKLNEILWPAILDKAKEMIRDFHNNGHKVVVIEAAVLIEAGWAKNCHEIWTCIVPPEEAIKRLQERNKMKEEDAIARVYSQPCNLEHVANAHVVFCTLWRLEYTKKQVDRAWNELMQIICPS